MPQLTNFPPSRRSFPLRGRGGKHTFRKGLRLAPDRLPRCVRQEHSEVAFGIDSDLRPNRFGCVTDVEVGSLVLADQIRARLLVGAEHTELGIAGVRTDEGRQPSLAVAVEKPEVRELTG